MKSFNDIRTIQELKVALLELKQQNIDWSQKLWCGKDIIQLIADITPV